MTHEQIYREIQDLTNKEREVVFKLIQAAKRRRSSPLAFIEELMNFSYVGKDEESNEYVHEMVITDELRNRYKMIHGGITATFIDTAMGSTVFIVGGENSKAVTLDLNIRFLAPGKEGKLTARTQVTRRGRTIVVLETKVKDDSGTMIATSSGTYFRLSE